MTSVPQQNRAGATSSAPAATSAAISLRALVEVYNAAYEGRDPKRARHLAVWCTELGAERPFAKIGEDEVFAGLERLKAEPARIVHGATSTAERFTARGRRSAATVNRYHMALSALFTFAIKRRLAPRGWENPARKIERAPERNQLVRFSLLLVRFSQRSTAPLLLRLAIARRSELRTSSPFVRSSDPPDNRPAAQSG